MSARESIGSELRVALRERRALRAKLEDIEDQRTELMAHSKVTRYVRLHAEEQSTRDQLARTDSRIADLCQLNEEAP